MAMMMPMRGLKGTRPVQPSRRVASCRPNRLVCQASKHSGSESPKPVNPLMKKLMNAVVSIKSFSEGGVGLFLVLGTGAGFGLLNWAKGSALKIGDPYNIVIELPLACGIWEGTPVRIRGVQVGLVKDVKATLEHVDVTVMMNDVSTVIPRNSIIEANQSGLVAEPLLDITPQLEAPLPSWTASPVDERCEREKLIVCENGRISGTVGVAMDDLVYIMTRMARLAEGDGYDQLFRAAERATQTVEDSKPLLDQTQKLLAEVTPLLRDLREAGAGESITSLTNSAAVIVTDIKVLQEAVLTDENVTALRKLVKTLCNTLENVELISNNMSKAAHDSTTQRELRSVVAALSKLVEDEK
eukprot:gene20492-27283_t